MQKSVTSPSEPLFLFDSLGSKTPSSSRKAHIRRLADVLQVCLHRHDWPRAQQAWAILIRCREFDWKSMWKTGLLLAGPSDSSVDVADASRHPQILEYMRVMMLRAPEHRIPILREMIVHLIISNRHQAALDELELYLPSLPYQDDPVLHIYAGLLRLYLAQASGDMPLHGTNNRDGGFPAPVQLSIDEGTIRDCKSHFQRALDLDPENPVASGFISRLVDSPQRGSDTEFGSDASGDVESTIVADRRPPKKKLAKG